MAGFVRNGWAPEEDAILLARIEAGMSRVEAATGFPGRSEKSVLSRMYKLMDLDDVTFHHRRSAAGSNRLRKATQRLMDKMDPKVLSELLWPPVRANIPGTERIYRGQGAEREFARPIGEIIKPIIARITVQSEAA